MKRSSGLKAKELNLPRVMITYDKANIASGKRISYKVDD